MSSKIGEFGSFLQEIYKFLYGKKTNYEKIFSVIKKYKHLDTFGYFFDGIWMDSRVERKKMKSGTKIKDF